MIKRLFIGIPFLLVGLVIGYGLREFGPAAKPDAANAQVADEAPHSTEIATAPHAADFTSLILDSKDNRSTDEWQTRLQRGIAELSISDIPLALDGLKNVTDLRERSSILTQILRRWAELEPRAAFDYLNALGEGEIKAQAMTEVARIVARSDPEYLADKAATMPANRARRELVQELTKGWAETDVRAALAWAEQLPEDLSKKDALAIVRFQWATQNPAEASAKLDGLPPGDSRNSFITAIAEQWGSRDPKAAVEWTATLSETEKALAMSNLIGAWAKHDPLAAGKFVAQLPPDETQKQAAMSVISNWANRDPGQAAAWVLQFPEGATREQGLREVVIAWTRMDSEAAREWARQLPTGDTRDAALKDFVESIAFWSPNKAAETVGLIDDPTKRQESMQIMLRSWSEMDPASARNWLAGLNMPEEFKARLRSALPTNW